MRCSGPSPKTRRGPLRSGSPGISILKEDRFSPGNEAVPFDEEAPALTESAGDADARRSTHLKRRIPPCVLHDADSRAAQIAPIVGSSQGKCLADLRRPAAQILIPELSQGGFSPEQTHRFNPLDRLNSPEKDRTSFPLHFRDDVAAKMHPVREVDIQMPPVAEHHSVSFRHPPVRVARGIPVTEIGFDFDDASDEDPAGVPAHEILPEKCTGNRQRRKVKETLGKDGEGVCLPVERRSRMVDRRRDREMR